MIHIEKDQEVIEDKNLKVFTATGDYEDSSLIEFYNFEKPEEIAGSFQAQYIKYGSLVYKFNDPKELGEEILKIDPESTHSAASYVRMTNELLQKMNQGSLEPESLDEVVTSEQEIMEEKREEIIEEENKKETENEEVEELIEEEEIIEEGDDSEIESNSVLDSPIETETEGEIITEPIEILPEEITSGETISTIRKRQKVRKV